MFWRSAEQHFPIVDSNMCTFKNSLRTVLKFSDESFCLVKSARPKTMTNCNRNDECLQWVISRPDTAG